MNKAQLLQIIQQQLQQDLLIAQAAMQDAVSAATDKENIPENQYDTLALEASYLAHGQSRRVAECEAKLASYQKLSRHISMCQKVESGAYVVLRDANEQQKTFFIAPDGAGMKVDWHGDCVVVISLLSPLGRALQGKELGDECSLELNGQRHYYEVVTIC